MADYIYLLENRLSQSQKNALDILREIAREKSLTVFLVGGAVRDLTSGSPVRDLDVVVQGNALKLKKDIEKWGGEIAGEHDVLQSLFVSFPGGAKVEIGSALTVTYPKPGKPVAKPASILEDLRRRDFTANAMAISLNTGSYGLLMDPLNGVADIENRELRLVSNYGFIEDPIRLIRAARLSARLGWQMDEKTQARYATGKEEGFISAASAFQRGYETEEIIREEDPLRVMRKLEAEGWMAILTPGWNSSKVNFAELERLRESQTQLQMQGIHPNTAAANFPLLTAKLSAKEIAELKSSFARPGFVREIEALDADAKEFAAEFSAKSAALPSQSWKLLYSAKPEAVLMVAHSSKSPAIQAKFKSFFSEWPLAKQKIPYSLLQEMRISPELPGYEALLESLTFELMDGKLGTVEEMKAFLEPFSPPAPPPPVHLRRARAAKKEAKASKARAKKSVPDAENEAAAVSGTDLETNEAPLKAPEQTSAEGSAPESVETSSVFAKPGKTSAGNEAVEVAPVKTAAKKVEAGKAASVSAEPVTTKRDPAEAAKAGAAKAAAKKVSAPPAAKKPASVKAAPVRRPTPAKAVVKPAATKRPAVAKKAAPAKKAAAKTVAVNKPLSKAAAKKAPAKKPAIKTQGKAAAKAPAKAAVKKPLAKTPVKSAAKKSAIKKRR